MSSTRLRKKPETLDEKWNDSVNQLSNRFQKVPYEVETVINNAKREGQDLSYTGKDLYNYTMVKAYNVIKDQQKNFNQIKDNIAGFGSNIQQGFNTVAQQIGGIAQQIGNMAQQFGNSPQQFPTQQINV